jgi:hypothetical protein
MTITELLVLQMAQFTLAGFHLDLLMSRVRTPLPRPPIPAYDKPMAKEKFELESPAPILDEEDGETLAAIDEGIRDAKARRTVPAEEVRKRLTKWIAASSARN